MLPLRSRINGFPSSKIHKIQHVHEITFQSAFIYSFYFTAGEELFIDTISLAFAAAKFQFNARKMLEFDDDFCYIMPHKPIISRISMSHRLAEFEFIYACMPCLFSRNIDAENCARLLIYYYYYKYAEAYL